MQRKDQVIIKRGAWRNTQAMVVQVLPAGLGVNHERLVLAPCGTPGDEPYDRINLASSSVELVSE